MGRRLKGKSTARSAKTSTYFSHGPRDVFTPSLTTFHIDSYADVLQALSDHNPSIQSPEPLGEDRRRFHPDGVNRSPASQRRSAEPIQAHIPYKNLYGSNFNPPVHVGFKHPAVVSICVRRKQRREVLMAKGHGGGGKRPPRRNRFSDVRC